MSVETVKRLIDSWQVAGIATWRYEPAGERVQCCVGEKAAAAAQLHFLQLETSLGETGTNANANSLKAAAASASMDFGEAVGERLAECLGTGIEEARWDAARLFWSNLGELARNANRGGSC